MNDNDFEEVSRIYEEQQAERKRHMEKLKWVGITFLGILVGVTLAIIVSAIVISCNPIEYNYETTTF